jgi:hypothetical protein
LSSKSGEFGANSYEKRKKCIALYSLEYVWDFWLNELFGELPVAFSYPEPRNNWYKIFVAQNLEETTRTNPNMIQESLEKDMDMVMMKSQK